MSNSDVSAQQRVLRLLKTSFPQAPLMPEPDQGTRHDLFELPADAIVLNDDSDLRSNLLLFGSDDLVEILPTVLTDLLTTQDRSGIEDVIDALDVSLESDNVVQQTKTYLGPEIAEKMHKNDEELYLSKLESFSTFDQRQASAIYEWLRLVREWPELKEASANVESAIQYWMVRGKIKTS